MRTSLCKIHGTTTCLCEINDLLDSMRKPRFTRKLNRYRITHLLWNLLAPAPCKLRMGRLRRKYPDTNWETHTFFETQEVAEQWRVKLVARLVMEFGWEENSDSRNELKKSISDALCLLHFSETQQQSSSDGRWGWWVTVWIYRETEADMRHASVVPP